MPSPVNEISELDGFTAFCRWHLEAYMWVLFKTGCLSLQPQTIRCQAERWRHLNIKTFHSDVKQRAVYTTIADSQGKI
jgi:hypothetical protein